jgi:hypothetical protein
MLDCGCWESGGAVGLGGVGFGRGTVKRKKALESSP